MTLATLPYFTTFTYPDGTSWLLEGWVGLGPGTWAVADVHGNRGRFALTPGTNQFGQRLYTEDAASYDLTFEFDLSEIVPFLTGTDPNVYLHVQLEDTADNVVFYEIYMDTFDGLEMAMYRYTNGGAFPDGTVSAETVGSGYVSLGALDTSQPMSVRVLESGTNRYFKVWQNAQPTDWMITDTTAPVHTGERFVDLRGQSRNEGSPNLYVDNIGVNNNSLPTYVEVGSTTHFNYWYDTDLGAKGATDATTAMGYAETDLLNHFGWFGKTAPWSNGPDRIDIRFDSPTHYGLPASLALAYYDEQTASIRFNWKEPTPSVELDTAAEYRAVWVHEVAHHHQFLQGSGDWFDYPSMREAHAAFLERIFRRNIGDLQALKGGGYAQHVETWLNSARDDFVNGPSLDGDDDTLKNYAVGCTLLFLNWLKWQKGYSPTAITQAGGNTPRAVYTNLTGIPFDPFQAFFDQLDAAFPRGTPVDTWAWDDIANPYPLYLHATTVVSGKSASAAMLAHEASALKALAHQIRGMHR